MSLLLSCPAISSSSSSFFTHHRGLSKAMLVRDKKLPASSLSLSSASKVEKSSGFCVRAFIFDPTQERILKEAIKEPVAFLGGVFAGVLRLDLNEDPLKEWITNMVEYGEFKPEELNADDAQQEETPQEIVIE